MRQKTYPKLAFFLAALGVALVTIAPAASAPSAPDLTGPPEGETVSFLPVFSWNPVSGADKYNFVLAADSASSTRRCTRSSGRRTPAPLLTSRSRTARTGGVCRRWTRTAIHRPGRRRARSRSCGQTRRRLHRRMTPPRSRSRLSPCPALGPGSRGGEVQRRNSSDEALSSLVTSGQDPVVIQATNLAPAILLSSTTYYWA